MCVWLKKTRVRKLICLLQNTKEERLIILLVVMLGRQKWNKIKEREVAEQALRKDLS